MPQGGYYCLLSGGNSGRLVRLFNRRRRDNVQRGSPLQLLVCRARAHSHAERDRERSQPHLRLAPAMRPAGDRNVTESLTLEECELPRSLLQLERLLRQQGVLPRLHGSPLVSFSPLGSRLPSDATASCRPPATVARQDQGHRSPKPTISTTTYAPQAVPILALLLFCPLARASDVPAVHLDMIRK